MANLKENYVHTPVTLHLVAIELIPNTVQSACRVETFESNNCTKTSNQLSEIVGMSLSVTHNADRFCAEHSRLCNANQIKVFISSQSPL